MSLQLKPLQSMVTPSQTELTTPDFWSDTFQGHDIAVFRHIRGWLVYIDQVMQPNRQFATAQDAIVWLHRKIEGKDADSRAILFNRRKAARRPARGRLN